jgi:hypothetical protein
MLEIYSQTGALKAAIEPSDSSVQDNGLMVGNVLKLSFTLWEFVQLTVNDYIDFLGQRFYLLEDYRPEVISTLEYRYDVEFSDISGKAKNAIVQKNYEDDDEIMFSLTGDVALHGQLMVANLNRITGTNDWVLGEVVASPYITIDYTNVNVLEGCARIAEGGGTEYWFEGTTLNFSRCEHGDPIELGYMQGLKGLSKSSNENAPFFTRLYPIGSTRNIVKDRYGYSRLRLPGGVAYVERNTQLGIVEYAEEAAFSHIYPRRVGTVSSVRSEDVKDEEGNPYTIYFFKDAALPFDPNNYEIAGQVKRIHLESGPLRGYDFDVNYNSETQEFEIITQFPDEINQLPGGFMVPGVGDEYVLYNITMPDEYYPLAEQELKTAVDEYLAKRAVDVSVYKAPSNYIYFDENEIDLRLGRRVRLLSEEYFEGGTRDSRVVKITRKVNNPSDMDIEFSYAVDIGRYTQLENNVADIQTAFREQLNKEALAVLKSWDSIDPTEYNVLSSVRTLRAISNSIKKLAEGSDLKYLFKDRPDSAAELITFLKGIDVVGEALIDRLVVTNEAMFRKSLSSDNFVSGFPGGTGWALLWDEVENAAEVLVKKSSLEIDEVTVRGAMRIYELIISQLSGENGTRITTDQMRVLSFDPETNTIYLDTDKGVLYNPFHVGDILAVQQYTGMPTAETDYNLTKSYEFEVTAAGLGEMGENRVDWIRFDHFVGDVTDIAPRDVLTRMDSVSNPDRKGIIKQTSVEPGAPYLDVLYGMKTDPEHALRARLGRLTGIIDFWWGRLNGYGLFSDNAYLRGDFMLRTGEDVQTLFEVVAGMLRSAMQRVTYNLTEEDNFLSNGSFTGDWPEWEHEDDMSLYMIEDDFINTGANLLSEKNSISEVVEYDGRQMLRLKNSSVRQLNDLIRKPEEGSVLYLGFRYICAEGGTLKIGFDGTAAGGDLAVQEVAIESSPEDRVFEISGLWDGAGDLLVEFSGDIYIEQLTLTNHPLDDYKKEVSTLFEQTEEHILAVATEINNLDNYVKQAGWITTADGNLLWASIQSVDDLGNQLATHEASFHVTAAAIEAMVTRLDTVEDEFSHLDSYVHSAGWITTADGNLLWATIDSVDALGEQLTTHEASFHVTAAAIESIVSRLDGIDGTISSAGWITTADGNQLWASKELEDGNTIISYINQTATTVTISASKIKLEGVVTANNYFKINTDGSMTAQKVTVTNGTFTDVIIQGSIRCAFQSGYYEIGGGDISTLGLQNNNNVVIPGEVNGMMTNFIVPFTSDYNGFRAVIVNDYWNGQQAAGVIDASAPSGKYFYENGKAMTSLSIRPKTGVEMIGLGEGQNFRGWLILNRFSTTDQSQSLGFPFEVMYAGAVTSTGTLQKFKGFDNSTLIVTRRSAGSYRITFSKAFSDADNYRVFLTAEQSGAGLFAGVTVRTTSYFDVYTGDDSSPNDGGFNFMVVNTHYW